MYVCTIFLRIKIMPSSPMFPDIHTTQKFSQPKIQILTYTSTRGVPEKTTSMSGNLCAQHLKTCVDTHRIKSLMACNIYTCIYLYKSLISRCIMIFSVCVISYALFLRPLTLLPLLWLLPTVDHVQFYCSSLCCLPCPSHPPLFAGARCCMEEVAVII